MSFVIKTIENEAHADNFVSFVELNPAFKTIEHLTGFLEPIKDLLGIRAMDERTVDTTVNPEYIKGDHVAVKFLLIELDDDKSILFSECSYPDYRDNFIHGFVNFSAEQELKQKFYKIDEYHAEIHQLETKLKEVQSALMCHLDSID